MQIGNIHIGKAENSTPPTLSIMEAALLWDSLVGRYKCIKETQYFLKFTHDPDFIAILEYGISFLEKQAGLLETQAKLFKLPLPDRPPIDVVDQGNIMIEKDRDIFLFLFEGCQKYIDFFARVGRSMVTNDPLRHIIVDFLTSELSLFDKLVKYGKQKGWLEPVPIYISK